MSKAVLCKVMFLNETLITFRVPEEKAIQIAERMSAATKTKFVLSGDKLEFMLIGVQGLVEPGSVDLDDSVLIKQ